MSSTSDDTGYDTISYINFTGGFPTSMDFAPSIVFLVAYVLTGPLLLYRIIRRQDRTTILIRPSIFYACRIAMLVLRAIMAKTTYNLGLLIGELTLVTIGFLFLIDPLIALWKRHVSTYVPKSEQPYWVVWGTWVLRILLTTSILTAVIAGCVTSSAFSSQGGRHAVRALRETSYILSLAVVVCLIAALLWCHFHFSLPPLKTLYVLAPSLSLVIVASFRVAQTYSNDPDSVARSKAAFWILQMFFEFIAYSFIIAVSIPAWFPGDQTPKAQKGRRSSAEEGSSGIELRDSRGEQHGFRRRPWYLKGPLARRLFKSYDD